jgi:hypothetical protein
MLEHARMMNGPTTDAYDAVLDRFAFHLLQELFRELHRVLLFSAFVARLTE